MSRRNATGVTLIELMITITIMALLVLVTLPLTSDWIDGNRQMRAKSNLLEAVGQARALAMRNPRALPTNVAGTDDPLAVAAVLYEGRTDTTSPTLCVVTRMAAAPHDWNTSTCAPDEDADADRRPLWYGRIANAGELELKIGGADFRCVAYDSRGIQRVTEIDGVACVAPEAGSAVGISVGDVAGDCADNGRRSGCALLL